MNTLLTRLTALCLFGFMLAAPDSASTVMAQGFGNQFVVTDAIDSVEIVTGTSRRLTFDYEIPEMWVENPAIIKANPIAPSEILITGLEPGVSTMTVSDKSGTRQQINVQVVADVRKLEKAIEDHFPNSNVSVHALEQGVLMKGYVARQEQLEAITAVARDYFPAQVINNIQLNQPQQVAIKVKVFEVSRTKLRAVGVDWAFIDGDFSAVSSVADLIGAFGTAPGSVAASGQNLSFGVLNSTNSFDLFIRALEQNNIAKLLDEPTIVTTHGRPAEFLSGGEIPIQVASGLGTTSIEFRAFGTKLDIVPLILGGGEMILEVRAEVSEVANDLSSDTGTPGFRVRRVNTGVKMRAGHTLALAGDFRQEVETEVSGIPRLMDSPLIGPLFRATEEQFNETELVFMITPRFISDVEPGRVPRLLPGQTSDRPSDYELYRNGYTEVPKCQDGCPITDRFDDPAGQGYSPLQQPGMNQYPGVGGYDPAFQGSQNYQATPAGYSGGGQGGYPDASQIQGQVVPPNPQGGGGFGYPTGGGAESGSGFSWPNGG